MYQQATWTNVLYRASSTAPVSAYRSRTIALRASSEAGEKSHVPGVPVASVHAGDDQWRSPDARLDAVIDLFGHAPNDIQRLLDEVRRIRTEQA
jgi:hypothetical protein